MNQSTTPTDDTIFDSTLPGLRCDHCGATVVFNLPLPIATMVVLIRSFASLHQYCVERQVFKVTEK